MTINLRKLLAEGHHAKLEAKRLQGLTETGRFRGGNTGYIGLDGAIRGQDARKALARYYGISQPVDMSRDLMFQAGEYSEDAVIDVLNLSWDGEIMTQKELPTYWEVDGIPVTGSPDVILVKDGQPVLGIEKKLVSAYNVAEKVGPWLAPSPKLEHVAQAMHYGMALATPWCLLYASRVEWQVPIWAKGRYPEELFALPELKTKINKRTGREEVSKIMPFYSIFYLDVQDDLVYYRHENYPEWVDTDITLTGIKDYFQLLADCIKEKKLPDRHEYEASQYWDAYSEAYNSWHEAHEAYDDGRIGYEEFLDMIRRIT